MPDCYADPRFDPTVDRATGYRTRCMLTLPLVDHKDALVGVMQVLNKDGGVFDAPRAGERVAFAPRLAVNRPTVFAITEEKPGGVVVSKGPLLVVAARGKG